MTKRTITIDDAEIGKVSDGYHTFDELYAHRCHLFAALMLSHPDLSWRAKLHENGTMFDNWFLAGMELPCGQISYHLPLFMWKWFDGTTISTHDRAPKWDGHESVDVLKRLYDWSLLGLSAEGKCQPTECTKTQ